MLWVTLGPEVKAEANRAAEARGWREPFVEQQQVLHSFGPLEIEMPKTAVPGDKLSHSFTFKHAIWPGMDALNLYVLHNMAVGTFAIYGIVSSEHPGEYGFAIHGSSDDPEDTVILWFEVPADPDDTYWIEIACSHSLSGNSATKLTHNTNPIGAKGATHAKECEVAEEWFIPAGTIIRETIAGNVIETTAEGDLTTARSMGIYISAVDADGWSDYMVGTKYPMSIEDIKFGDVPIDTSSFEPTTWGCAAGANKLWAEGTGSGIGFWASDDFYCGSYVYCGYPGVTINAPFSYDFSPMEFKLLDGSDAPDSLELYVTGIRTLDAGGVDIGPWHGTIADLRALGRYTQQHGCYSWDTWDPDMQAEVQMYISLTSALAHNLYIGGETLTVDGELAVPAWTHDGTVIFDCWTLSSTNRTDAPYVTNVCSIGVEGEKDIYANAHTHEDWIGANVSTPTAGGEFVVGAGGGSLALTLACNYPARQAAVGNVDAIPVPTAYRTRRHDALLGTGNPVEGHEAVWDWRGRYLLQSFKDLSLPCDLTCRIVYYDDLGGCSDNHKTDSTRQTEYSYSAGDAYTLERTITVTYADGSDWSPVLIDLYDEQNGHPLARVESIEWEFPDAGTYTMTEPQLVLDPGDRQEVASGTPGYREAPSSSGAYVKIDEHWQYAQGVVSGHVNGLCDRVLFMPDHVKPCTVEHCFDTLNVLIGAETGTDLTTCYSLGGWPINNAGEAWGYTYSSGAEAMHMKDSDGAVLKTLAVSDIRPEYQLAAVGDVITPSVAVRAYSITCVRGLAYTFYGRKIFNGRGHCMVVRNGRQDYPRARSKSSGPLQRRYYGTTDPWQTVEATLSSDEHGHWASAAWEIADTDAARTLWEYAVRGTSMGRFATREFALLEIYPFAIGGKRCGVYTDPDGVTWYAWIEGSIIYVAHMLEDGDVTISHIGTTPDTPTFSTAITVDSSGDYDAVDLHGDGRMLEVGARNSSDEKMYAFRSYDMGNEWHGPYLVGA